jgi:hypothetical protein
LFNYFGFEEHVEIPDGVVHIDQWAFVNCDGIQTVVIPNSVTKISNNAFSDCENLQTVFMGQSVSEIGEDLFHFDANVTIHAPTESYAELYAKGSGIPFVAKGNVIDSTGNAKDFVIEDGVLVEYKGHFKDVTIPEEVVEIGDRAFIHHHELHTVNIPDHV